VDRFRTMADHAGSALEVAVDGPVRGTWDRGRVDQVLTNLVANAVKYGAGEPVRIEVAGGDASVRVAVIDRGVGIEPDSQPRLFQRFERAASTRDYGGLGLGLWISRQIVEAMEGSIQLERSLPGQGSTFAFALPRQPSAATTRGTPR
jgi:signal transduction histidine kinase